MASRSKKMSIMTRVLLLVVVLMSWTTITTKAQTLGYFLTPEWCIGELIPCGQYLGMSNPGADCCEPLKLAIETRVECVCVIINDSSLGIMLNTTKLLQLPLDCGIKVDPNMCNQHQQQQQQQHQHQHQHQHQPQHQGSSSTPTNSGSSSSAPASISAPSDSTFPAKTSPSPSPSASTSSNTPLANASSRTIALAAPISSFISLLTLLIFY